MFSEILEIIRLVWQGIYLRVQISETENFSLWLIFASHDSFTLSFCICRQWCLAKSGENQQKARMGRLLKMFLVMDPWPWHTHNLLLFHFNFECLTSQSGCHTATQNLEVHLNFNDTCDTVVYKLCAAFVQTKTTQVKTTREDKKMKGCNN